MSRIAWRRMKVSGRQYSLNNFLPRSLVTARPTIFFSALKARLDNIERFCALDADVDAPADDDVRGDAADASVMTELLGGARPARGGYLPRVTKGR